MQIQSRIQRWKLECLAQWDKQCLKSNEGFSFKKESSDQGETFDAQQEQQREILHRATPDDTLEGLSLLYNVSVEAIKSRNQLYSNQIYYVNELVIPNGKMTTNTHRQPSQAQKIDELLQKLSKFVLKREQVKKILSQSRWDIDKAVARYHESIKWQKDHSLQLRIFRENKI